MLLGHKASLSKFKRTEIMPIIFLDYKGMKLEVNNRRKFWKIHKL